MSTADEIVLRAERAAGMVDLIEYYVQAHQGEFPDLQAGSLAGALDAVSRELQEIRKLAVQ